MRLSGIVNVSGRGSEIKPFQSFGLLTCENGFGILLGNGSCSHGKGYEIKLSSLPAFLKIQTDIGCPCPLNISPNMEPIFAKRLISVCKKKDVTKLVVLCATECKFAKSIAEAGIELICSKNETGDLEQFGLVQGES